jgi:hypothetical protein
MPDDDGPQVADPELFAQLDLPFVVVPGAVCGGLDYGFVLGRRSFAVQ